jgi:nicotinamidase-related amidase
MSEQPIIPAASTALILNDMINGNLRGKDARKNELIAASGIIQNSAKCVAAIRERKIPVFWIRVERRADQADVMAPLTDAFLAGGRKLHPPTVRGSYEAANVDELPVLPQDHVILKPRFDPFFATDLDYQLRARKVDTLLLGGYATNFGVENCARSARDFGYNVVLLSDCSWNIDHELHEFAINKILPFFARVMPWEQAVGIIQ